MYKLLKLNICANVKSRFALISIYKGEDGAKDAPFCFQPAMAGLGLASSKSGQTHAHRLSPLLWNINVAFPRTSTFVSTPSFPCSHWPCNYWFPLSSAVLWRVARTSTPPLPPCQPTSLRPFLRPWLPFDEKVSQHVPNRPGQQMLIWKHTLRVGLRFQALLLPDLSGFALFHLT